MLYEVITDDRVPREDATFPGLDVAVPQLLPGEYPAERPPYHPRHDDGPRVVEPDHSVAGPPGQVAHPAVVPVYDEAARPGDA